VIKEIIKILLVILKHRRISKGDQTRYLLWTLQQRLKLSGMILRQILLGEIMNSRVQKSWPWNHMFSPYTIICLWFSHKHVGRCGLW